MYAFCLRSCGKVGSSVRVNSEHFSIEHPLLSVETTSVLVIFLENGKLPSTVWHIERRNKQFSLAEKYALRDEHLCYFPEPYKIK